MTIKAIIFDFDGTILDTEVPDYESWQEVFQSHGTSLSLDEWAACVGGAADDFDPYRILAEQVGQPVDRSAIRQQRRTRFADLVEQQPIMPGVMQWLDDADAAGIKLALASSSDAKWVYKHLEYRNLTSRFVSIRTRDDVERVKPDPALYRISVNALGIDPHEAVAIEDSRNGLLAAKAAGLHCIAVPNPITQHLDFGEADIRLRSLADLSLAELFEKI